MASCLEAMADPGIDEFFNGAAIAADGEGRHAGVRVTGTHHIGCEAFDPMHQPTGEELA
jgi:hypothetical protein